MVLVLISLFMGVSYADNNVWVDVNTTSKVEEIDKSTWDDDIDRLFAETEARDKEIEARNKATEARNKITKALNWIIEAWKGL